MVGMAVKLSNKKPVSQCGDITKRRVVQDGKPWSEIIRFDNRYRVDRWVLRKAK